MNTPPPSSDDHNWYSKTQNVGVLVERIDSLRSDLGRIERKIDNHDIKLAQAERDNAARYVTQDEFKPVMRIVYGAATVVLIAFLTLVVYTVGWRA